MCVETKNFPSLAEAVEMVKAKYGWANALTIESKWVPPGNAQIVIQFSYNDNVTEYWNALKLGKRSDGSYNPASDQCLKWEWDFCVDLATGEMISDAESPYAHGL